jgi:uncharacterized surface protein with fasciclin (FAS1) repeats
MKTSHHKPFSLLMIALSLAATPLLRAQAPPASKDIVEVARETVARGKPIHTTLVKLLDAAGLTATLKSGGPYTLFAPIDGAWTALPNGKLDELQKPENKEELIKLLKHHIVAGKLSEPELAKLAEVTPLEGPPLKVTVKGILVKQINDASTADDQHEASNGIVYRVKKVLLP